MIRVLVVDDIKLMSAVTGAVLADEDDIEIVGTVTSVEKALALLPSCDILLLSTALEHDGALALTDHAIAADPPVKVVVMGVAKSVPIILEYIERGAAGYVLKDDSIEELLKNIRATYNDKALMSFAKSRFVSARGWRFPHRSHHHFERIGYPESGCR